LEVEKKPKLKATKASGMMDLKSLKGSLDESLHSESERDLELAQGHDFVLTA
jgi:hypothetical protein